MTAAPSPEPASLLTLLGDFLHEAREHATDLNRLACWLRTHERLQRALAVWLADRLTEAPLAPSSMALAKVVVESLRETCDDLYRPHDLVDDPERLLRQRADRPPAYKSLRLWMACRLKWFAGGSVDTVARQLSVHRDTVKRLLAEAGPAIDQLWIARFAPDLH
jgi:hypothetical protein